MEQLYHHAFGPVPVGGRASFRLCVAADAVGLFTVEYAAWPMRYPAYVVEPLGMSVPFGVDEIPYNRPEFGGGANRRHDIAANREIDGVFLTGGPAAKLTLSDVQSQGLTEKSYKLTQDFGSLLLTIRVTAQNYRNGCASLEFTNGLAVPVNGRPMTRLVLNTTPTPASLT